MAIPRNGKSRRYKDRPRMETAGTAAEDLRFMRVALQLARKGVGNTSPNPMVGAVVVRDSKILGRGYHHRAGEPHAEVEALSDAVKRGHEVAGSTLYVTLEPCSTHGRTPPCTQAILNAGISRVVAGATDPNPRHGGKGFQLLRRAGVKVRAGVLAGQCGELNEAFNHWIVHKTPLVTVKAAMTLDGKIATSAGDSKWITGEPARRVGMSLRRGSDAILVGINTILADNPSLTFRDRNAQKLVPLRRIVLDSLARTPLDARVVSDKFAWLTTIVVSRAAPFSRVRALRRKVQVFVAPKGRSSEAGRGSPRPGLDLRWVLERLGEASVTSLLVEGGGEVNASFLMEGLAQRVAFFYAPKILGGRDSRRAVAGNGARRWEETLRLEDTRWRRVGEDLFLSAKVLPH